MKTEQTGAVAGHTAGPWTASAINRPDLDDDPLGEYRVEPACTSLYQRYVEADIESPELEAIHAENRANARLIAAAPCLLQALEALLAEFQSRTALIETCDMDDDELAAIEAAEKAIDRATGGQP